MARLTGGLAALAHFRGTSCRVDDEKAGHLLRRINDTTIPEIERARAALRSVTDAASELTPKLQENDFELLVELIFSRSGWRRESLLGGTQELVDMELTLPTTGERAFVQVKSKTTPNEFSDICWDLLGKSSFRGCFMCSTLDRSPPHRMTGA
jgi:hypothetical protein